MLNIGASDVGVNIPQSIGNISMYHSYVLPPLMLLLMNSAIVSTYCIFILVSLVYVQLWRMVRKLIWPSFIEFHYKLQMCLRTFLYKLDSNVKTNLKTVYYICFFLCNIIKKLKLIKVPEFIIILYIVKLTVWYVNMSKLKYLS